MYQQKNPPFYINIAPLSNSIDNNPMNVAIPQPVNYGSPIFQNVVQSNVPSAPSYTRPKTSGREIPNDYIQTNITLNKYPLNNRMSTNGSDYVTVKVTPFYKRPVFLLPVLILILILIIAVSTSISVAKKVNTFIYTNINTTIIYDEKICIYGNNDPNCQICKHTYIIIKSWA